MLNKPLLLIFLLFTSLELSAQNLVVDKVVWVVGDEPILKSEIETEIMRMKYEKTKFEGDPYCTVAEQMALQKLFIAQAKIDSVEVSESTIKQQVDGRIQYFTEHLGSKEKVEEYFNKPMSKMREDLTKVVSEQMLMQEMQQRITKNIKVTPQDINKFYAGLPKDSIPTVPEQVEVQVVVVSPEITNAEKERVKSQLRDFREKIESGEYQFSTLAILYSEDRGSALQGGELGFKGKGMLTPEFANAAFSLYDPTKVSRIIETEFGYHIIQLIEKKGDQVNCRHILLKPQISYEQKNVAMKKLDSLSQEIRKGKITFEQTVLKYSEDKNTKQNGGLMINKTVGNSKFQYQELPAEIAKEIYSLNIGEISKPFVYTNEVGKQVVAIARVKSKIKAHLANPEDDFQELKTVLTNKKSAEVLEQWIIKKQAETYIHIDPEFSNCEFKYSNWIKK